MEPGLARDLFSSIPFVVQRGRRSPVAMWHGTKAGLDFVAHNLPPAHHVLIRLNPYPRPWRHVRLAMRDGAKLAAWYGPGKPGAPALLLVPGTFQTKDDTPRKRRAIDLWRRFGLHVLVVDMRGFGGSHAHVGSAGKIEADDVHEAASWLAREAGSPRVTVWGESFGGVVSLLAACRDGAESRFERVVAWSPYADLADAALAASPQHPRGQTRLGRAYRFMLRQRDRRVRDFHTFLRLRAESLGVTEDDLVAAGSPARHVARLRVPAFVFHAEDDPVVPIAHARQLESVASPNLFVQVVPHGAHLDFDIVAPAWYRAVTERIFAPSSSSASSPNDSGNENRMGTGSA